MNYEQNSQPSKRYKSTLMHGSDRHSEKHSIRSSISLKEGLNNNNARERTISVAESIEVSVESTKPERFNPELLPKYFNNAA